MQNDHATFRNLENPLFCYFVEGKNKNRAAVQLDPIFTSFFPLLIFLYYGSPHNGQ